MNPNLKPNCARSTCRILSVLGHLLCLQFAITLLVVPEVEAGAPVSVADWLIDTNPALAAYAARMADYGYEDLQVLDAADQADLEEAFRDLNIKKPHRRLILKSWNKRRLAEKQEDTTGTEMPRKKQAKVEHESFEVNSDGSSSAQNSLSCKDALAEAKEIFRDAKALSKGSPGEGTLHITLSLTIVAALPRCGRVGSRDTCESAKSQSHCERRSLLQQ
jgi:hypothetical protein